MDYNKPICDECGEELLYRTDKVLYDVEYKIKENGQITLIEQEPIVHLDNMDNSKEMLRCPNRNCGGIYEVERDGLGRLKRGFCY